VGGTGGPPVPTCGMRGREQAGRLFLRVFDGGYDFEEFDGGEAVAID
jgi:hypothetical protein